MISIALAKRVRKAVLAEPKRVDMNAFCRLSHDCETVGCIAGHAMFLAGMQGFLEECRRRYIRFDEEQVAGGLLRLSQYEAHALFYFHAADVGTPYHQLAEALRPKKPGTRAYARVVAQAIDLCIERNKE